MASHDDGFVHRWLQRARPFAAVLAGALALVVAGDVRHGLGIGTEAHATVSVLVDVDDLVAESSLVVVGQPVERFSRWEEVGKSKRIVTYTRIVVEESLVGPAQKEVWVRTLGGKVDNIGQQVAGEASFTIGNTSLVFLAPAGEGFAVTAMAQGHFPLIEAAEDRVLTSSPDLGTLVPKKDKEAAKKPSAREELVGATLTDARKRIAKAKKDAGK